MQDLTKDQLNGCPKIGTKVKMMGITAIVIEVKYVSSHNCWVLVFKSIDTEQTQTVPATKVSKAIKDNMMTII